MLQRQQRQQRQQSNGLLYALYSLQHIPRNAKACVYWGFCVVVLCEACKHWGSRGCGYLVIYDKCDGFGVIVEVGSGRRESILVKIARVLVISWIMSEIVRRD